MSKPFLERIRKRLARDETRKLTKVVSGLDRNATVLEVGCGFGRKLQMLGQLGFTNLEGLEVNPAAVERCREKGLKVFTPAEFRRHRMTCTYDVLLLSHVVEHFAPHSLLNFLNEHLHRLKPGGHLVVLTPLISDHGNTDFWLDFDHVRPYPPQGFKDFFGHGDEQVSTSSPHRLKIRDVRFRKSPFRIRQRRSLVLKTPGAAWWRLLNVGFALLFKLSFGVVGRTTGWVGLFEKMT